MLKQEIRKFIFKRPALLRAAKATFSNRLVANNPWIKKLTLQSAKRHAKENREYERAISIETTLSCNSRCVFCAHHNQVMTGTMTTELFEKIISDCRTVGIKHVDFGVYGEFLTDKLMFDRIAYLQKYEMTFSFFSNASLLSQEMTRKLLKLSNFTSVNFSVNGFSKEVYERIMVGLQRDVAYKNILYFLEQKEKLGLNNLTVHISAVKTELNKKDFKDFFRFWKKQKGVSMIWLLELMDRMGENYNGQLGELGPLTQKSNWLAPCKFLWDPLRIYYDGKVSSCCKDDDKRELVIGDLTKESLRDILAGKALNNLRLIHLSGKRKNHSVCGKCYLNSVWIG